MFKFFFLLFNLFLSLEVFSTPSFGWELYSNSSYLYINGSSVFDSRDRFKSNSIPSKISSEHVSSFAFYTGEYFILRSDKDSFANLILALKQDKSNESLVQILITFQKIELDQEQDAVNRLDEIIAKDENQILTTLAKVLKSNLKKKSLGEETKESIKNLSCQKSKPYFQICKVLKLKVQMDVLVENSDYVHRDYLNLDRVLAPFFEDVELQQIYFIDKIIPDISPKLAHLGFAFEASFFQKNIAFNQKVAGILFPSVHEKLAYYQMLSDDLLGAEETMNFVLKKTPSSNSNRNSILLKLAAISSFRKDHKQALNYYSELNFKNWNPEEKNPFFQDNLSPNQARELIAIAIWKTKSALQAVKALNQLHPEKSQTEENLFIRLRIAQIIMSEKPEVAEKMTEDILYLAQSNNFKRVEYAATELNGYCNILTKKYRKSTVQFTKSYGILGDSDPVFSSEWMRNSGTLFARIMGGERGNHSTGLKYLLNAMKLEEPNDEVLIVKNYIDSRFDADSFYKLSVNYFASSKNYANLLETLYSYQRMKSKTIALYNKSILQVPDVNRRIKYYRGLRPASDNLYYKNDYSRLREQEAGKLISDSDKFDLGNFKDTTEPVLAGFSFNEKIYYIHYENKPLRWNLHIFNSIDYRTSSYYEKILSLVNEKFTQIQIFLNPIGLDSYLAFRKNNPNLQIRMFYSFTKGSQKKQESNLNSVAMANDSNSEQTGNEVNFFGTEFFEGIKFFPTEERLHIWNVKTSYNREAIFEGYEWRTNSSIIFQKLMRRMDLRTTPSSILIDKNLFSRLGLDNPVIDFYFYVDFFFRKGTRNIFLIDSIEPDKITEQANILSKPINSSEDFYKTISLFKNSGKEIFTLTKEMK